MAIRLEFKSDSKQAQKDISKLNTSVQGIDKDVQKAAKSFNAFASMAKVASAAFAGVFVAKQLTNVVDSITLVENRIALVTGRTKELNTTFAELQQIALKSRGSIEGIADLYNRLGRTTKSLGVSNAEVLQVTETIQKAITISGSSAQSAEAAIVQLGQGLAAGALRGQELNSVMEQTPRVASAIAAELGVGIGELRRLAEQGKITSEVVVAAFKSQQGIIDEEYAAVNATVGQGFIQVAQSGKLVIAEFVKGSEVSDRFAEKLMGMATALTAIAPKAREVGETIGNFLGSKKQQNTFLDDMVDSVNELTNGAFDDALNFVQKFTQGIDNAFAWVYDRVVGNSWWPDLVDEVVDYTSNLWDALWDIQDFTYLVQEAFKKSMVSVHEFGNSLGDASSNVAGRLASVGQAAVATPMPKDYRPQAQAMVAAIGLGLADLLQEILGIIEEHVPWLFESAALRSANMFLATFATKLSAAFGVLGSFLASGFQPREIAIFLKESVMLVADGLGQIFGALANPANMAVLLGAFVNIVLSAAKAFGDAFLEQIPIIGSALQTITLGNAGFLLTAYAAVFTKLPKIALKEIFAIDVNEGKNLVTNFLFQSVKGSVNSEGKVVGAMYADNIYEALKTRFGRKSEGLLRAKLTGTPVVGKGLGKAFDKLKDMSEVNKELGTTETVAYKVFETIGSGIASVSQGISNLNKGTKSTTEELKEAAAESSSFALKLKEALSPRIAEGVKPADFIGPMPKGPENSLNKYERAFKVLAKKLGSDAAKVGKLVSESLFPDITPDYSLLNKVFDDIKVGSKGAGGSIASMAKTMLLLSTKSITAKDAAVDLVKASRNLGKSLGQIMTGITELGIALVKATVKITGFSVKVIAATIRNYAFSVSMLAVKLSLAVVGGAITLVTAGLWGMATAFYATPVGWITAGIIGLGVALVALNSYLTSSSDTYSNFITALGFGYDTNIDIRVSTEDAEEAMDYLADYNKDTLYRMRRQAKGWWPIFDWIVDFQTFFKITKRSIVTWAANLITIVANSFGNFGALLGETVSFIGDWIIESLDKAFTHAWKKAKGLFTGEDVAPVVDEKSFLSQLDTIWAKWKPGEVELETRTAVQQLLDEQMKGARIKIDPDVSLEDMDKYVTKELRDNFASALETATAAAQELYDATTGMAQEGNKEQLRQLEQQAFQTRKNAEILAKQVEFQALLGKGAAALTNAYENQLKPTTQINKLLDEQFITERSLGDVARLNGKEHEKYLGELNKANEITQVALSIMAEKGEWDKDRRDRLAEQLALLDGQNLVIEAIFNKTKAITELGAASSLGLSDLEQLKLLETDPKALKDLKAFQTSINELERLRDQNLAKGTTESLAAAEELERTLVRTRVEGERFVENLQWGLKTSKQQMFELLGEANVGITEQDFERLGRGAQELVINASAQLQTLKDAVTDAEQKVGEGAKKAVDDANAAYATGSYEIGELIARLLKEGLSNNFDKVLEPFKKIGVGFGNEDFVKLGMRATEKSIAKAQALGAEYDRIIAKNYESQEELIKDIANFNEKVIELEREIQRQRKDAMFNENTAKDLANSFSTLLIDAMNGETDFAEGFVNILLESLQNSLQEQIASFAQGFIESLLGGLDQAKEGGSAVGGVVKSVLFGPTEQEKEANRQAAKSATDSILGIGADKLTQPGATPANPMYVQDASLGLESAVESAVSATNAVTDTATQATTQATLDIAKNTGETVKGIGGLGNILGNMAGSLGSMLGGLAGNLFGGMFANGGSIPSNKFGLVGESGPELISGPAKVYSAAKTEREMAAMGAGGKSNNLTFQLEGDYDSKTERSIRKLVQSGMLQSALNGAEIENGGSSPVFRTP